MIAPIVHLGGLVHHRRRSPHTRAGEVDSCIAFEERTSGPEPPRALEALACGALGAGVRRDDSDALRRE